jgi:hypothetical protein
MSSLRMFSDYKDLLASRSSKRNCNKSCIILDFYFTDITAFCIDTLGGTHPTISSKLRTASHLVLEAFHKTVLLMWVILSRKYLKAR